MRLNELAGKYGAWKKHTRVGRGIGSGLGKTSGKGGKGQTARSGVALNGFEGGQMPLHMRVPKRGFNKPFRARYQEVNTGRIQAAVDSGKLDPKSPVDTKALTAAGLIRKPRDGVRLLGSGELKAKLTLHVASATKAAAAAVEKVGGSLVLPPPPKEPARKIGRKHTRVAKGAKPKAGAADAAPAAAAKPAKAPRAPKAPAAGAEKA